MKVTVPSQAFNAMNASMKKVLKPVSFRIADRRVWLRIIDSPKTGCVLQTIASDGLRLYEDRILATCEDPEGPRDGSFVPVRLKASKDCPYVTIDVAADHVTISFDDVTFTSPAVPQEDLERCLTNMEKFLHDYKGQAAEAEHRASASVNPKYIGQVLDAFSGLRAMRLDVGRMIDPIIVTGGTEDHSMFRMVMPIRSGPIEPEYRKRLAADAAWPGKEEIHEEDP